MENTNKTGLNHILSKYRNVRGVINSSNYENILNDLSDQSFSSDSEINSESDTDCENSLDDLGLSDDNEQEFFRHIDPQPGCSNDDTLWNDNNQMPKISPFIGDSGIKVPIPETPLGFLQLFVTRELLEHFKKETNLYSEKRKEKNPNSYKKWKEVSVVDIAKYLGLTILFGIFRLPRISNYWKRDEPYFAAAVTECMSYSRYTKIRSNFHSNSNTSDTDPDRLKGIRPVIDYLIRLFKLTYTPSEHLSIDEGILGFKGRLCFKDYNPCKPIKYGIKTYILAESNSGYVYNFTIYSGTGNTTLEIVTNLMEDLKDKNYHVYMDNYYNSVGLSEKLLADKIYSCGTLRIVRGAPKFFQASLKQLKKGDITFCRKSDTFVIVWKDKKLVTMVTTNNNASTEPISRNVKSKKKGKTVYQKETVNKPRAVIDYNKHMKGVDHYDQMIRYYSFARRSSRWTKKATMYLLQMAIFNAYALYRQYTTERKVMDLQSFHSVAYKALMNFKLDEWPLSGNEVNPNEPFDKGNVNPNLNMPDAGSDFKPHSDVFLSQSMICYGDPLIRLDTKQLHIIEKIPNNKRRRCRVCSKLKKAKLTGYECKTCFISLCQGKCYSYYHTYKDYVGKIKQINENN